MLHVQSRSFLPNSHKIIAKYIPQNTLPVFALEQIQILPTAGNSAIEQDVNIAYDMPAGPSFYRRKVSCLQFGKRSGKIIVFLNDDMSGGLFGVFDSGVFDSLFFPKAEKMFDIVFKALNPQSLNICILRKNF